MYETFEHTADMGLRIRAAELGDLFADAARAMFSVMVADLGSVRPSEAVSIVLDGGPPDELLRRWLAELLYVFNVRRMLFCDFEVQVGAESGPGVEGVATTSSDPFSQPAALGPLRAIARGEPIDFARHLMDVEIKAVTWHGLKVQREPDGWLAEVIVDI